MSVDFRHGRYVNSTGIRATLNLGKKLSFRIKEIIKEKKELIPHKHTT